MPLNRFFLLSLGTSLLVLSACAPQGATQWMPKGYTYQDNTPLSSPAPSSPWLDEAVINDTEKLASNTAAWQGSVYELVALLEPTLPKDGTPLRLEPVSPISAHDMALDHYLRQTLVQKGYNLTTTSNAGMVLTYDATGPDKEGSYLLTVSFPPIAGQVQTSAASIHAVLPYEKDGYDRLPGYSGYPIQGKTLTPAKVVDRQ